MATTAVTEISNFIGGEDRPPADGATEPILNPATGEQIAAAPLSGEADVDAAVKAADGAFREWAETPPGERALALLKIADAIEERGEELSQLESLNVGKPIAAMRDEIPVIVDNLRFFAGAARTMQAQAAGEYMQGYTSMLRREPVGVVGQVAPWNYPLMMAGWKIGPALAAGNTVVLKPSEQTPMTAAVLAHIAAEHLPAGVLNVIFGHGKPAGAALVSHPTVAMVSLTGDVATGKEIARAAAETVKRVHLELGGKAPVLVFDDADIEAAVEGVKVAGYWNTGQDCTAASRVIAGPKVYDDFVSGLADAAGSLSVGDPTSDDTEMGPLVSRPSASAWRASSTARRTAPSVWPAASRARGRASSSSPRWWRASGRATRWCSARCSARRHRAAVRVGRAGHRVGQRRGLRAGRQRGRATWAAPWTPRAGCASARCGSTTTSRWSRRCRTAASSSPATARTCRSTRSRTTPS